VSTDSATKKAVNIHCRYLLKTHLQR